MMPARLSARTCRQETDNLKGGHNGATWVIPRLHEIARVTFERRPIEERILDWKEVYKDFPKTS